MCLFVPGEQLVKETSPREPKLSAIFLSKLCTNARLCGAPLLDPNLSPA
jgi:hypothetical protein